MTSVIVIIINVLLKFVMRRFSQFESHDTQTKHDVSVAFKLTIARFFNSSITLTIVNSEAIGWFDGGDLVQDAQVLIAIIMFQASFMEILNIPGIIKWCKIRKQKALTESGECQLT